MQLIYFALLAGLIPLIGFAFAYKKNGLDQGVWTGCALSVLELVVVYFWLGIVDYTVVFAIVLFLVLGIMSIKSKDETFFKLQPAIMFFSMSLLVFYHQLFDQPLFLKYFLRYQSKVPKNIVQQLKAIPNYELSLTNQSLALGVGFLICALVMFYVAKKHSIKIWLFCRAFVLYIVCLPILFVTVQITLWMGAQ